MAPASSYATFPLLNPVKKPHVFYEQESLAVSKVTFVSTQFIINKLLETGVTLIYDLVPFRFKEKGV
jgi:hypothetical protein